MVVLLFFGALQARAAQPADVVRNPADVPATVGNRAAAVVRVNLFAREVVGVLDPSSATTYGYWTFNGKVPGPMIRAREGDTIEVTLHNDASSRMVHSVDFHAAIGPGGGAAMSQVMPGQSKTFTFRATTPGLFVYHCGTPMIADHIANGMYGLILIEPAGGLPHVDHEYYVMQGEIYTTAAKGHAGLQQFSEPKLLGESPEYFVFNGAVDALTKEHPLTANTGETVRIFFGNAGPNESSSLHVVGEIFTHDYELGSLTSAPLNGVQTANVPPGAAAIVELKAAVPGQFSFMDHAMSRMAKGLMGTLQVKGPATADLMHEGGAATAQAAIVPGETKEDSENLAPAPAVLAPAMPTPMAMPMSMPAKAPVHAATRPRAAAQELDGCLAIVDGNRPMLTLYRSHKQVELEPKSGFMAENPLAFASNVHALVAVTGQPDRTTRQPWFVVSSIHQLSPTCDERVSLAQLRGDGPATVPSGSGATVGMGDMTFQPAQVTITAGQQVTWKNTSSVLHNVVDDASQATVASDVSVPRGAKPFASSMLLSGQTFSRRFDVPGVYHYVCTLHEGNGMKGVIIVRPAPVKTASAR